MAVCLDASFVGALLLQESLSGQAATLYRDWEVAREEFVAPTLLVAEVGSLLRKAVYTGRISSPDGLAALDLFIRLPIRYHEMLSLSSRAWAWGERLNTPRIYDLYYLSLAEVLDCDLWVVEEKLKKIVGGTTARVRWVGDMKDEFIGG